MSLDLIFLVFFVYGFYIGFTRGIIRAVFSILAIAFGILAAMMFSPYMTKFLEDHFSESPMMFIVGFVLTFITVFLLFRIAAKLMESLFTKMRINVLNKIFGGALMAGFYLMIYSWLLLFGVKAGFVKEQTRYASFTYPYMEKLPDASLSYIAQVKPVVQDFKDFATKYLERMKHDPLEQETGGEEEDIGDGPLQ